MCYKYVLVPPTPFEMFEYLKEALHFGFLSLGINPHKIQRSYLTVFDKLPVDVRNIIIEYLYPEDWAILRCCSRRLRDLVDGDDYRRVFFLSNLIA